MRLLAAVLLSLSLVGCAAESPEPSEMPSSEVNAPQSESTDGEAQETESGESATEVDPETEPGGTEPADSPEPKPSASPSEEEASPSPTPTKSTAPKPSETSVAGYTLDQVAERNSQTACWVAIDGMVYDLTDWIRQHPGGRASILSLCGTDGTNSFLSQHGGQSRPSSTLEGYLLGPLTD